MDITVHLHLYRNFHRRWCRDRNLHYNPIPEPIGAIQLDRILTVIWLKSNAIVAAIASMITTAIRLDFDCNSVAIWRDSNSGQIVAGFRSYLGRNPVFCRLCWTPSVCAERKNYCAFYIFTYSRANIYHLWYTKYLSVSICTWIHSNSIMIRS